MSPVSNDVVRSSLCLLVVSLACNQANDGIGLDVDPEARVHPMTSLEQTQGERRDSEILASGRAPDSPSKLRDADIRWDQNAVMKRLGHMEATLTESEYTHGFSVNERKGIYNFDCSGMTYWVLKKATPRAASALAYKLGHRPLARDIQRRIASIPVGSPRHGWQRIPRVDALEPGDVIAWIKPKVIQSPNTGHVGFVVLPPVRAPGYDNAYLVRFADSTRLLHDDDTRQGRNGFGKGTILLVSDPETGAPIAYGWVGLRWRTFETDIALGRPLE